VSNLIRAAACRMRDSAWRRSMVIRQRRWLSRTGRSDPISLAKSMDQEQAGKWTMQPT
jgi:hypothetical protein